MWDLVLLQSPKVFLDHSVETLVLLQSLKVLLDRIRYMIQDIIYKILGYRV